MSKRYESLPMIVLNGLMRDDYRETVVRKALEHLKARKGSPKRLEKALHSVIQIDGFSKCLTSAPMIKLLPATVEAFQMSNEVTVAVLQLWVEVNRDLATQLYAFLEKQGVVPIKPGEIAEYFEGFHLAEEMNAHLQAFQEEVASFDEDNVCLMYLCLRGTLPGDSEMIEEERTVSQAECKETLWDRWLKQFQDLPPDAPEWETIDTFIAKARALAEQKAQEYQGVLNLQEALNGLRNACTDQIEFFQMRDCNEWQADLCPPDQITAVLEKVKALRDILARYNNIRQETPATLADEREQRQELGRLEEQVADLHRELQILFGTVASPTAPLSDHEPAEAEVAAVSEEKEESEIPVVETVSLKPSDAEAALTQPPLAIEQTGIEVVAAQVKAEESQPIEKKEETATVEETVIIGESDKPLSEKSPSTPAEEELDVFVITSVAEPPLPEALSVAPEDVIESEVGSHDDFIWHLLIADDIPAAYWYVLSLESQGKRSPVSLWLLATLQGARWLEHGKEAVLDDMARIAYEQELSSEKAHQLLGVAAALYPTLVAPESNLLGWIDSANKSDVLASFQGLKSLVRAVCGFASSGLPLYPEILGTDSRTTGSGIG